MRDATTVTSAGRFAGCQGNGRSQNGRWRLLVVSRFISGLSVERGAGECNVSEPSIPHRLLPLGDRLPLDVGAPADVAGVGSAS